MKTKLFLIAGLTAIASTAAMADGAALYAEKTCIACHGKEGKKPLTPTYPKLAGQNAGYLEQQMLDIRSGARANGSSAAMKGVMVNPEGDQLVSDKDIKEIAQYLSKLK
ncbi:MAG: c-type cytochrome [Burkholderiales bacterium]|nr:c-type cytochrome [Burkholderiales bacterium]